MSAPALWLIAGPNGVGKTTYALGHIVAVSGSVQFVNLDTIARGLSPLAPETVRTQAARIASDREKHLIARDESFSLETTLAGRTHLRLIAFARARGFRINLLYFAVPDVAECLRRIRRRVAEGGHDVPEPDARRRFHRSAGNFPDYAAASDLWRVFDNRATPRVVAEGEDGRVTFRDTALDAATPPDLAAAVHAMPAA